MKTIILTGGGTAGHVFGCLALLPKLETFFDKIVYIGGNGIEKEILKNYKNIQYFEIPTTKLERKFTLKNLAIPFVLLKSILECKKIITKTKPNIIFSKGGFVSLPVVLAGASKKVPTILHESDLSLGLANKLVKNKAKVIFTSFKQTALKLKNGVWSGSPIRPQIFCGNKQNALKQFNVLPNKQVLTIVGGSLGATFLNKLVEENFNFLCQNFFVIHITGKNKKTNLKHKNYVQCEYVENIQDVFALTNLAITRGGSNAIFEFLALQIPMLIVPLSKKVSRGDQIENAKIFEKEGFAKVLMEEEKQNLQKILKNIVENQQKIKKNMQNYAKTDTLSIIFDTIKKHSIKD